MISQYIPAPTNPVAGMVKNHAVAISPATPHRTLFTLSAAPTPMMAVLTTCVVDTGPPIKEAPSITAAEDNCEQKASTGFIL